jgi:hypothetical protein
VKPVKPNFINDETARDFVNANPEGINQYSKGGGKGAKEGAKEEEPSSPSSRVYHEPPTKSDRAYHKSDAADEASKAALDRPSADMHHEAAYYHDVAADAHHAARNAIIDRAARTGRMSDEDQNEAQKHGAAIQRHEKEMASHRAQARSLEGKGAA